VKQAQKFNILKPGLIVTNESGQAAIEYVLLLVIIVSMLIASKGLFDGANKFINAYVGDYFVCLMDHGELPAQGISDSELKQHASQSNCKATFTITGGVQLAAGGASGLGGGNNSNRSSSSSNKGDSTSAGSKDKDKDDKNNETRTSGSTASKRNNKSDSSNSSQRGPSPYQDGRLSRLNSGPRTADGSANLADNKSRIIDDELDDGGSSRRGYRSGRSNSSQPTRKKYKAITGGPMLDEVQRNSKPEPRKPLIKKASAGSVDEGFRPGPRKSKVTAPERAVAQANEDKAPDFGLAGMLKWLIIAGLVIIIIVFFGGQVLNYSNSE
jgi:hypothetical protein